MILKIIGCLFVALAVLGIALPVLPTTPFLLVAAACFAKSSPRLHQKLLDHKAFGPLIRDWQEHRSISRRSKRIAQITMVLAFAWSCYMIGNVWVLSVVALLMIGPFIFVSRLPLSEHKRSIQESNVNQDS